MVFQNKKILETFHHKKAKLFEGPEGVKWELGLIYF